MSVSGKDKSTKTSLYLETQKPILTFQGMAGPKVIFTKNDEDLYPEINRVSYTLIFKKKVKNFQKLIAQFEIKNNNDYLKNMKNFVAVPLFQVILKNNMPHFSFYEYRTSKGDSWKKIKNADFDWSALEKINLLKLRAINKFGRPGPITFLTLSYQK